MPRLDAESGPGTVRHSAVAPSAARPGPARAQVQGVWFRAYTEQKAKTLGLVGYVQNSKSGTVSGEAQGPHEKMASMAVSAHLAWLTRRSVHPLWGAPGGATPGRSSAAACSPGPGALPAGAVGPTPRAPLALGVLYSLVLRFH